MKKIIVLLVLKHILTADLSVILSNDVQNILKEGNATNSKLLYNDLSHQLIIYAHPNQIIVVNLTSNLIKNFKTSFIIMNNSYGNIFNSQLFLLSSSESNQQNSFQISLWKFNLISYQQIFLANFTQPNSLSFINLLDGHIIITTISQQLNFSFYSYSNYNIQKLTIQYEGQCLQQVVQWDNKTIYLTIPIQDIEDNCTQLKTINIFTLNGNLQEISIIKHGNSTNTLKIISSFHAHVMKYFQSQKKIQIKYLFDHHFYLNSRLSQTISVDETMIVGCLSKKNEFSLNFYQNYNTLSTSINQYSSNFYATTSISQRVDYVLEFFIILYIQNVKQASPFILILGRTTKIFLQIYKDIFYNSPKPKGLLESYYGINKCLKGWTGKNCTQKSCHNSININASSLLDSFTVDCSGHGICKQGVCRCYANWSGQDCSTYERINCKTSLIDNFPLKDCECRNSTIGGNSCNIIFCPGDCFSHGVCMEGRCICNENYFGVDCSIMILDLPN